MKLSPSLAAQAAFLTSLSLSSVTASRIPLESRGSVLPRQCPDNNTVGAAYFINNEPSGNYILAASINSDGTVALSSAIYTGGVGQHGIDPPSGPVLPSPLFSQGSVVVSANASLLATVNPGSNTISLFEIDPADPTSLKMVGGPVGSNGEFPVSLTFNSGGDTLCVMNSGALNSVQCFNTTDRTRGLQPITGSFRTLGFNLTTPPMGPPGSPSQLLFSADDLSLYVAIKGNPTAGLPGVLAVWDVAPDGSLSSNGTRILTPQVGAVPFALANIPQTPGALLVVDQARGVDVVDFSAGVAKAAATNATEIAVPGQLALCWVAHSPRTGSFYITDLFTYLVTEIAVDGMTPKIVGQYLTEEFGGPTDLDVASFGGNDYMIINVSNRTELQVFSLPAQGQALKLQTLDVAGPAAAAGVTITPENIVGLVTYIKPNTTQAC
ncbi:hypothetical protein K488DRAFT_73505 [Vararia minispora EC-137]|uniref:Uncharacterized protein n=1 Tax=Vararia minispora EC-137 TaxID=1314806 RepID=A0ACB8QAL5_9AGAM|nr:hypothetical protein K488DRAFT_73505 [Vararia minispora EC-137]